MTSSINTAFMSLSRRAESTAREKLIQTFVDVGPLFTLLSSHDHQVIYGRRGTGKTHALAYLADRRESEGDVAAYVDLRNIGSTGGIYADPTCSLSERATRLLIDTLSAIHNSLLDSSLANDALDLSQMGPALDDLADAVTNVRVVGSIEREESDANSRSTTESTELNATFGLGGGSVSAGIGSTSAETGTTERSTRRVGIEQLHVNFGTAGAAFRRIATAMGGSRLWVLLDEWSSVPGDLQPYLADLLRRSLFPTPGITVKLAAIEQRSQFQLPPTNGDYLGIEVGADASADVNLDDFMVFDNDSTRAKAFFRDLLFRHYQATEVGPPVPTAPELIRQAFTQTRAFEEFVRASEGVPRDAINVLGLAAQKALNDSISIDHIRVAARNWYHRDKDSAVRANESAHRLLHWVIDTVIGERRARAFLLESSVSNQLIDTLYDSRVLHLLKRGISTHDRPGARYDVYKLDFGCYVDLLATARGPVGLLPSDESAAAYVEVPPDDYRSIRRAILDLERFEKSAAG